MNNFERNDRNHGIAFTAMSDMTRTSNDAEILGSQYSLSSHHFIPSRLSFSKCIQSVNGLTRRTKIGAAAAVCFFLLLLIVGIGLAGFKTNGGGGSASRETAELGEHLLHMQLQRADLNTQSQHLVTEPPKKGKTTTTTDEKLDHSEVTPQIVEKLSVVENKLENLEIKLEGLEKSQNETSQLSSRLDKLEQFNEAAIVKEKIGTMVTKPLAFLYTKQNQQGQRFVFNDQDEENPPCLNLPAKVYSINTQGTCVRLFTQPNCYGVSLPFFTGGPRHHENIYVSDGLLGFTNVSSVGPCLVNELENATLEVIQWKNTEVNVFHKPRQVNSTKEKVIPDLLYSGRSLLTSDLEGHYQGANNVQDEDEDEDDHFLLELSSEDEMFVHPLTLVSQGQRSNINVNSSPNSNQNQSPPSSVAQHSVKRVTDKNTVDRQLTGCLAVIEEGHKGRVEYVKTVSMNYTYLRDLWEVQELGVLTFILDMVPKNAQAAMWVTPEVRQHYDDLQKKSDDKLGLVIGFKLGGPRNSTANVFPQSLENMRRKAELEELFIGQVRKFQNAQWSVEVNFDYAGSTSTRPTGFTYRINKVGTNYFFSYYLSNY